MKLCIFELRKQLSGKLLPGVMVLLLIINAAFCRYYTSGRPYLDVLPQIKAADKVFRSDPETARGIYDEYKDEYDAYEKALKEYVQSKGKTGMPPEPSVPCTIYDGVNDYLLFSSYFSGVISQADYEEKINSDINDALKTLRNYKSNGFDENSYSYRYLVRYYIRYSSALEEVKITEGRAYGWDALFAYSGTGLFVFLAALFVGARLFTVERDHGMDLLLRTTRRGRRKCAAAKIVSAFFLVAAIVIVFTLSSMAVIGRRIGFSSPFDSVQQISEMFYCPYTLNMLTCLLLTMAVTLLAAYVICLLTAAFSLMLRRAFGAMLVSAGVVGLFFFAYRFGDPDFIKYVNIFTAASANDLLGVWRAVHVGTYPVSQLIPLSLILFALFAVSATLGVCLWSDKGLGVSGSTKGGVLYRKLEGAAEKFVRPGIRSLSLTFYELKKLFPVMVTVLCLLLIAFKIVTANTAYDGARTFSEEMKRTYIEQYCDTDLPDAYEAVNEQLAYYDEITLPEYISDMAAKRVNKEITSDEYNEYRAKLDEARNNKNSLQEFGAELEYLLEKADETGVSAMPVISSGFSKLTGGFEALLVALILLLFCGIYAREYESEFVQIIRTTRKGRKKVFFTKTVLTLVIGALLSLLFSLTDALYVFTRYDMTCVSSPLFAVRTYLNTSGLITIGQYLILIAAVRMAAYAILAMLVSALSGALRSEWGAAGVTLLLFIPYLLRGLGFKMSRCFRRGGGYSETRTGFRMD